MKPLLEKAVEEYLYGLLPDRDEVLLEMEERARRESIPIVGPAVGRVLHQYARLVQARRIFELGSAIGYSTIWLARACPEAQVFYTDGNPKNAEEARRYFERAGVADRISVQVGDALELLEKTPGEFDLVFNDVDKHDYPRVFDLALPRLRRGGLFLTDNALWSGRVTSPPESGDTATPGVQELNRKAFASAEVFATLLPLRDGLLVCEKL